ncbi:hypothetical protein ACS3QZ_19060 [Shimia sp. W99]
MESSDYIALGALLLSFVAIWQTRKGQKSQERLTDREVELVRRQLAEFENIERASKEANVSARLYSSSKNNWKLRIFNTGPADACNVDVEIVLSEGSMLSKKWLEAKLPLKVMEKGASVDINAFVHLGSAAKEEILIKWDDPSGKSRVKRVEVTL